jgi:carboxyl-terminal processing protease
LGVAYDFSGEICMRKNPFVAILAIVFVVILLSGVFLGGVFTGRMTQAASSSALLGWISPKLSTGESTAVDREALFRPFWQAWDLVHERYVAQPVDDVALMRGAIQGMLKSLGDEHTSYLDPETTKRFQERLEGEEYEGIGAWVDISGDYLKIISPMPGMPAEKAGIKTGDEVIAVDGEDMTGVDGELVLKRVLGPKGTEVRLTIRRPGQEEPFDIVVKRAAITVPSIESRMLDENIGYIRLSIFRQDSAEELRAALKRLLAENPDGLILDLRSNGGGLRDAAIQVASEFIGDGVIMYEEYGDGTRKTYNAEKDGLGTQIPMVVLINEGTASASEIVAGAIQDHQRGKLVGVQSFGKGSVQTVQSLVDEQGQVRVTIARWLTPLNRQINKIGLTPDILVEITEADIQKGIDAQLQAAIQALIKK